MRRAAAFLSFVAFCQPACPFQGLRVGADIELVTKPARNGTDVIMNYSANSAARAYAKLSVPPCAIAKTLTVTRRTQVTAGSRMSLRSRIPAECGSLTVAGVVFLLDSNGRPVAGTRREIAVPGNIDLSTPPRLASRASAGGEISLDTPFSFRFNRERARSWKFRGQAGLQIRLTVDCADLDPSASLFAPGGALLAWADDGEGWNVRLPAEKPLTLPDDGEYLLEVRPINTGVSGSCRVVIAAIERS